MEVSNARIGVLRISKSHEETAGREVIFLAEPLAVRKQLSPCCGRHF